MSQEELARRTGINRSYMGSIERGYHNTSFRHLVAVAEALRVQPSEIIARAERHLVPHRKFPTIRRGR